MSVPPRNTHKRSGNFPRRQAQVAAEGDFAWPPRAEDLEACTIVPLGDDVPTVSDWGLADAPAVVRAAASHAKDAPGVVSPPASSALEAEDPLAAFADSGAPVDPWSRGELARAAAAVCIGVSLAVVSYAQFRSLQSASKGPAVVVEHVAHAAEPEMVPPARPYVVNEGLALLRGTSFPEPSAVAPRPMAAKPLPVPVVTAAIHSSSREDALPSRAIAETVIPRPVDESRVELRPAPPAPVAEAAVTNLAAVASAPEPIAIAARVDPSRDEDHIRATLAQWRTAYSQLNAGAAREVWPSVDVRALERAFQSVKSQELSFDHCDFTVNGARAQAACTGRASYVPRVGNPSPKTNTREWKFELTRSDQRWTIASASASSS